MQLGRIIGHATATVKHPSLQGWRMIVVQLLDARGHAEGDPQLAIDSVGCGKGDTVVLTTDGKGVRQIMKAPNSPVRWAVIGRTDQSS